MEVGRADGLVVRGFTGEATELDVDGRFSRLDEVGTTSSLMEVGWADGLVVRGGGGGIGEANELQVVRRFSRLVKVGATSWVRADGLVVGGGTGEATGRFSRLDEVLYTESLSSSVGNGGADGWMVDGGGGGIGKSTELEAVGCFSSCFLVFNLKVVNWVISTDTLSVFSCLGSP